MTKSFDFELEANDQVMDSLQRIQAAVQNLQFSLDQIQTGLQLVGQSSVSNLAALGNNIQGVAKNAQDGKPSTDKTSSPLNTLTELNVGLSGLANVIERVKNGVVDFAEKGERIISNGKNMGKPTEADVKHTGGIKENVAARGFKEVSPSQVTMLHAKNEGESDNRPQVDDILKRLMSLPPVLQNVLGNGANSSLDRLNNVHQASNEIPYTLDRKQPQSKQIVANQHDLNIANRIGSDELKAKEPSQSKPNRTRHSSQGQKKGDVKHPKAVDVPNGEQDRRIQVIANLEKQTNIPTNALLHLYQMESGMGKYLYSPTGPIGPFQFSKATGKDYNLNTKEDRLNFDKSSLAAAEYFSDLLRHYGGNVDKAMAAYNGGEGYVDKNWGNLKLETRRYHSMGMVGLPHFWSVDKNPHYRKQTQEVGSSHVKKAVKKPTPVKKPANINGPKLVSAFDSPDALSGNPNVSVMDTNRVQIELTLINSQTGKRNVITGTGPKVTAAMLYA